MAGCGTGASGAGWDHDRDRGEGEAQVPHTQIAAAEIRLPASPSLHDDLAFYQGELGFRLEQIFPAEDPAVAVLSGHGVRLRLERGAPEAPGTLRLTCRDPAAYADGLVAPNGTRIEIDQANPPLEIPQTAHAFAVRQLRDGEPWIIGRAGMAYRDLIPDRLGGSIIASHIRIPDGGPVPDMVHYHTVGFQLIYCYRGWVDLVYEDQGPPFRLGAGDCVIQPPEIRHRVLFASDNIEVIEIGVPAEHITTIDHEMELPTPVVNRDRDFSGQRFCHHRLAEAAWTPWRLPGFDHRETGIADATSGVAGVQVARVSLPTPVTWRHDTDIHFSFVLEGALTLSADGHADHRLTAGDAFTIPPGLSMTYADLDPQLELLEVSLPGRFATVLA
ncbi:MAG: cupin domain-containing protein [Pseudomonadota bacterium]